jgi:hypothetical protein
MTHMTRIINSRSTIIPIHPPSINRCKNLLLPRHGIVHLQYRLLGQGSRPCPFRLGARRFGRFGNSGHLDSSYLGVGDVEVLDLTEWAKDSRARTYERPRKHADHLIRRIQWIRIKSFGIEVKGGGSRLWRVFVEELLYCTDCLCDTYLHSRMIYRSSLLACFLLVLSMVQAVKFQLPSERHPKPSELLHPLFEGRS